MFLHDIQNILLLVIKIKGRDHHSWNQLFPKRYVVNMLGEGIKSKSDAHFMRPADVGGAWKNL